MPKRSNMYELYYWPSIQGRGEFIRLALEDAGARYVDMAREPSGMRVLERLLKQADTSAAALPFAPPFLRSGKLLIAQTTAILHYLGPRLGLSPATEAGSLAALQYQLTLTDWVAETHDVHHPIGVSLYYEDQKPEALRRSHDFRAQRIPKFLSYFERVLSGGSKRASYLTGSRCSYVDLSLFQVVEGLRYAFPNAFERAARKAPRVLAHHDRIAARPRLAAYLASPRRLPFNEDGIFRHYPELDSDRKTKRKSP